jgi:hypothetical protein
MNDARHVGVAKAERRPGVVEGITGVSKALGLLEEVHDPLDFGVPGVGEPQPVLAQKED